MSFLYREMETCKMCVNTTNMKWAYQVFVVGVQKVQMRRICHTLVHKFINNAHNYNSKAM
jgi:hypothetical protein